MNRHLEFPDTFLEVFRLGQVTYFSDDPQSKVKHIFWLATTLKNSSLHSVTLFEKFANLIQFSFKVVLVNYRGEPHSFDSHRWVETKFPQTLLTFLLLLRGSLTIHFLDIHMQVYKPAQRRLNLP